MHSMRILYVEDEAYLASAVTHLLKKADIAVDWVANGEEGLKLAVKPGYDCLVLDIMLPGVSGWDILKEVRSRGMATPILMLSALSEVDDKVRALESGADDYLAKPFKTAELIARLKALTRRPPLQTDEILQFADLEYDLGNRSLNGVALTAKEAELFELLIRHPEQIQPKAQLLARAWGNEAASSDNYVEVYMSYLRKKLEQLGSSATIKTVRNLGYKLTNEQDV